MLQQRFPIIGSLQTLARLQPLDWPARRSTIGGGINNLLKKYPIIYEIGSVARQYVSYYDMIKKALRATHS